MKKLKEYITEQDIEGQPITFYIYNTGPKNQGFEITIGIMWHKMGNFKQHMLLCPLAPKSLRYKQGVNKDSTNNFTKIPEIVKYAKADSWQGWNKALRFYLYYEIKPFIKHGKISVTMQQYDKDYVELIINDKDFNDERNAKLVELEDTQKLEIWKSEYDERERINKEKAEAEAKAKQEYEKWESNLSDEDKRSRSMGYGPHHPYEDTHPWNSPGFKTSRGWYTGD